MWYHGERNNVDAIGYATSEDGIIWEKYQANPVLELGSPGSWDGIDLQMGCVLIDGETYKMYYDGHGSEGWVIGLATSLDGIHWTKDSLNNPVLPTGPSGNWDDLAVWSPHVIKDESIYKMWFTADELPAGSARRIGYAVSDSGINWEKHPNPVIEEGDPSVLIYYTESPSVIFDGENYHMWYSRENNSFYNQIDYAVSADGINWIKDSLNNPVLNHGTDNSWHRSIYHPNVIESNNLYRMWFVGSADSWAVGYAEDFSNLVHADSIIIEEPYVEPNTDPANILGRVINLEGHAVTAKAMILSDDGSTQDSVELFDDGLNGDGIAGDGIYGGFLPVSDENFYTVGIKTIDQVTGFTRNGLNWNIIDRFTTAGPVKLDSISISDRFGYSFNIKPFVLNQGTTRTITDASIKLICNDPWNLLIAPSILSLPDIPPGATVGTSIQFSATYSDPL
ncbi:MAG: choice-of-anchor X domain-containing protein, partial [Ignavibacteriaceae bacterium]